VPESAASVPHRWGDGTPVEVGQAVVLDIGHTTIEGTVERLSSSAFFVGGHCGPTEYCVVPGHVRTGVCRPALSAPSSGEEASDG
jgi:hypothetical protein